MRKSWTRKKTFGLVLVGGSLACALAGTEGPQREVQFNLVQAPPLPPAHAFRPWPNQPPPGCPFPQSEILVGVAFTGRHVEYTGADTWYPSWAADGNLYSPWKDGNVNGLRVSSGGAAAPSRDFVFFMSSDPRLGSDAPKANPPVTAEQAVAAEYTTKIRE